MPGIDHFGTRLLVILCIITACGKKENPPPPSPSGTIVFSMVHQVNEQPLKFGELVYSNAAGNQYSITDLIYFISDVTFYQHDGKVTVIGQTKDVFYVNEAMPETKTISFTDKIPAGDYDSVAFTFGISAKKNKSHLFVNPPEVWMGWPDLLGGGYHFLMMNGNWKTPSGELSPYNLHLGTGQLYKGSGYNVDSIYAFVDNSFTVHLLNSSFRMEDQQTLTFGLKMNIAEWFRDPHVYDFNYWGGAIMQNQPAMQMVRENGWNVFTLQQQ